MRLPIFAVAAALAPSLSAGYSNLIATSDGNAVYLQAKTGFVSESWYVVRNSSSGLAQNGSIADVSGTGTALVFASYADRYCGTAGSTCFVRAPCVASWVAKSSRPRFEPMGPLCVR